LEEFPSIPEISVRDAAECMKQDSSIRLIDVRTDEEYKTAHLAGSLLLNDSIKLEQLLSWPKDTRIFTLCHHGMRSLDAAGYLISQGFSDVQSISGGIDAWSRLIDPKIPRY
jgi:rhodanese-related sulfurtransferase